MKRLLALSSLFAIALTACQAPTDGDTIKIGYIGPLTGEAASFGVDILNGAKLAVDEINADGGIDGRQIKLIAEDGRCTGTDAASAAQKLINVDKVVAIVGGQCSGETLAAAPIAEAAEVVMVSSVSSSPDVTTAGDFIFRVYPSDALKTKVMAKYFSQMGYGKVAIITENTDYAIAFRDALVDSVGEDAVVFNEVVEPSTKDFRTLITRLQKTEFDVFVPNGQTDAVIAAMMQQLREQGLEQPAVGQDASDSVALGELATEAVEGMRMINTSSALGGGDAEALAARFREQYGEPQSNPSFVTLAYDAAGVLFQAIRDAGTEGPAIRDYLYNLSGYDGAAGTFSFDSNGDVVGIDYALKEFQDGKIVEIKAIPAQ